MCRLYNSDFVFENIQTKALVLEVGGPNCYSNNNYLINLAQRVQHFTQYPLLIFYYTAANRFSLVQVCTIRRSSIIIITATPVLYELLLVLQLVCIITRYKFVILVSSIIVINSVEAVILI